MLQLIQATASYRIAPCLQQIEDRGRGTSAHIGSTSPGYPPLPCRDGSSLQAKCERPVPRPPPPLPPPPHSRHTPRAHFSPPPLPTTPPTLLAASPTPPNAPPPPPLPSRSAPPLLAPPPPPPPPTRRPPPPPHRYRRCVTRSVGCSQVGSTALTAARIGPAVPIDCNWLHSFEDFDIYSVGNCLLTLPPSVTAQRINRLVPGLRLCFCAHFAGMKPITQRQRKYRGIGRWLGGRHGGLAAGTFIADLTERHVLITRFNGQRRVQMTQGVCGATVLVAELGSLFDSSADPEAPSNAPLRLTRRNPNFIAAAP